MSTHYLVPQEIANKAHVEFMVITLEYEGEKR